MSKTEWGTSPEEIERKKVWLADLADFLVEGNANTYAAGGAEVAPERQGYKELEYKRGVWRMRDSYAGYFRAPGMTGVYYKDFPAPVWAMQYGGTGMIPGRYDETKPAFNFLKKALMQITPDLPYRGPAFFEEGEWKYKFRLMTENNLTDFSWTEEISAGGVLIFTQMGMGGIIIHKDTDRKPVYPWNL